MSLLRQNKDTLMGVLEPFIRDPTVSWGRAGRAQRTESVTRGPIGAIQDNDNTDAKEALLKIMERLNGVYNLCHPSGEDVIRHCLSSLIPLPLFSFVSLFFHPFFLHFCLSLFLLSLLSSCLLFFSSASLPPFLYSFLLFSFIFACTLKLSYLH